MIFDKNSINFEGKMLFRKFISIYKFSIKKSIEFSYIIDKYILIFYFLKLYY